MFDILALLFFVASIVHCQLCYTPSGGILEGYGPCNPTYATSLCCAVGDHCLSNSLCETPNSIFYRGGCTSKAYLNGECPSFCGTGMFYLAQVQPGSLIASVGIPYFPPGIPRNAGGSAIRVRQVSVLDLGTNPAFIFSKEKDMEPSFLLSLDRQCSLSIGKGRLLRGFSLVQPNRFGDLGRTLLLRCRWHWWLLPVADGRSDSEQWQLHHDSKPCYVYTICSCNS